MSLENLENVGEHFNLEDYFRSQAKTREIVLEFSKTLIPGMTEKEARQLLEDTLDKSGLEKRWHPTKLRMGPNTTKSFRDISDDYTLLENDIFFVDVGPVYYNHEGDYGETFVVGNNAQLKKLAEDAKIIFYSTQAAWKELNLTGKELYAHASEEAQKLNLKLNSNMYGHRLGDFPHAVHSKVQLGTINFSPAPQLWVLEIHVINEELGVGAFFEDILV